MIDEAVGKLLVETMTPLLSRLPSRYKNNLKAAAKRRNGYASWKLNELVTGLIWRAGAS
jgi:hypothetical protein